MCTYKGSQTFADQIWYFLIHLQPMCQIWKTKCKTHTEIKSSIIKRVPLQVCSLFRHIKFRSLYQRPTVPYIIPEHYKFSYWFYVI
jgi:hypothetical protein